MLLPGLLCASLLLVAIVAYVLKEQRAQVAHLLREHARLRSENAELRQRMDEVQREKAAFLQRSRELQDEKARLAKAPRKSEEELRDERLERQLDAVRREGVTFARGKVMNGGELAMFYAALHVTRQRVPTGAYPFYVFPQVSLGQVIRAEAGAEWQSRQAHRAINSKRCDLLLADTRGNPVAVFEYQGGGHDLDGTAKRRDDIKRVAVEGAGIRFVEVADGTGSAEMQRIIEGVLAKHVVGSGGRRVPPSSSGR